jgi:antitoxin component YwqK of YwqJK toxin-antitoxin module
VKEFNDKRQLISEAHYQSNKLHGLFVRYDTNGKILSRENYKQGLLHGPAEYFYKRGGKMFCASCNYQDNLLQGSFIVKESDTELVREKTHFMKGLRHGERCYYYENGKTESQEVFVNGVLHGERKVFYPDGPLWFKEEYANGKPDGERIGYWPNGEKFLEELYSDGLLHGERKTFTKDGSLIVQEEYHWGKIVHNTETPHKKL